MNVLLVGRWGKCSMERALLPFILASMAISLFVLISKWSSYSAVLIDGVTVAGDGVRNLAVEEGLEAEGIGMGGGNGCDLFEGDWVWDERYPLYESKDCPFLDQGFRCSENGRPDRFYTNWRWQPKKCNLPSFDAKKMLEQLRNRRLVFAGDSIGRNQWESLLCMLSSTVDDKSSIYEVNGSPITKHKGFLAFMFKDYNCTLEYYRSPFLVRHGRPPSGLSREIKCTIKLDVMDHYSTKWRQADVLILNAGHWWNHEKTVKGGCFFQVGPEVKKHMNAENAYQISIHTLFNWISREINTSKTQVFFRTYSPVHYRNADRRSGGNCRTEILPESTLSHVMPNTWVHFLEPFASLSSNSSPRSYQAIELLNITYMTALRKDGHSSIYHLSPGNHIPIQIEDCSHWCLPGVPDSWNEILYALFFRRQNLVH